MPIRHICRSTACAHAHMGSLASQASPIGRRGFLTGAAALGALATSGIGFAGRALAQAKPHRIDVHHHITPPKWLDAVKKGKFDNPPMANWSPQKSIEDFDKAGIATAITSPTTPQVNFLGKEDAAAVAEVQSCADVGGDESSFAAHVQDQAGSAEDGG